jgi:hypothetical protein
MSADEEKKESKVYTEEELLSFKEELGIALKERTTLHGLLQYPYKPISEDDVEKYLEIKRAQKMYLNTLLVINDRIEFITNILVK